MNLKGLNLVLVTLQTAWLSGEICAEMEMRVIGRGGGENAL